MWVGGSGGRLKELAFELGFKGRMGIILLDIKREGRVSGNVGLNMFIFYRITKRFVILEL